MELLQQLNQEGSTIVMVTHAPEHVNYGTRVIELLDGNICKDNQISSQIELTTAEVSCA
jgi:putative ABC transport system ATP-binding protein